MSTNTVITQITSLEIGLSKNASWEELAWLSPCTGISSSAKFSLNSCSHSWILEYNECLCSFLDFIVYWFWDFIGLVIIRSHRSVINRRWNVHWRDGTLNSISSFSSVNFTYCTGKRRTGRRWWAMTPVLKVSLKLMSQIQKTNRTSLEPQ